MSLQTRSVARTVGIAVLVLAYGLLLLGITIAGQFGESDESSLAALLL